MLVKCDKCHKNYNDSREFTFCPHEQFLTDDELRQKDLAISLLGKQVRFASPKLPEPKQPYRIVAVDWHGMVEVSGMSGWFAPHLFEVVSEIVNVNKR